MYTLWRVCVYVCLKAYRSFVVDLCTIFSLLHLFLLTLDVLKRLFRLCEFYRQEVASMYLCVGNSFFYSSQNEWIERFVDSLKR